LSFKEAPVESLLHFNSWLLEAALAAEMEKREAERDGEGRRRREARRRRRGNVEGGRHTVSERQ
jgi:hypothetical protein